MQEERRQDHGIEHRMNCQEYCLDHSTLLVANATMGTKMDNLTSIVSEIKTHIEGQVKIRTNWWIATSTIIIGVLIQTSIFCYWLGQISRQIEVNTQRITTLEQRK